MLETILHNLWSEHYPVNLLLLFLPFPFRWMKCWDRNPPHWSVFLLFSSISTMAHDIFIVWACILSQAILFQYVGKMWIATSIPLLILSHILLLLKTSPSVRLFLSSKEISYPFESSAILFSSFQGGGMLRWCFPLFFFLFYSIMLL